MTQSVVVLQMKRRCLISMLQLI
ncbi:unnamed protein product [Gulo gulo]|uniref:Uncharacterized protein n=1 Tax=Gulo gulo TaxID=48420 RepID=A0A9X9LVT1_GULGU|nr:unnamed protein product [Gulo gulo]